MIIVEECMVMAMTNLRVRIEQLALAHKELKALSHAGQGPVGLGQGGHHLRVVSHKSGVDDVVLQEVAHELVHEAGGGARGAALHVELLAQVLEELVGGGIC